MLHKARHLLRPNEHGLNNRIHPLSNVICVLNEQENASCAGIQK